VVFDLDGTLADSQEGILRSFHLTLVDEGIAATDEELRHLIGPPLEESFARLGIAPSRLAPVVERYRAYYDQVGVNAAVPYDGGVEVVRRLRDGDVRLAVATAKRVDFARRMLARFDIADCFDVIEGVSGDDRIRTKNDVVDAVRRALGESGVTWMVGDRRQDVEAARHASWVPVGVLWGYGTRDELLEAGAALVIDAPSQLVDAVLGDVRRETVRPELGGRP
jgi:phosphoglycolate phosphatase